MTEGTSSPDREWPDISRTMRGKLSSVSAASRAQAGGGAQLERLCLSPPGDLQGVADEFLHLLEGVRGFVEERLLWRAQASHLGA